MSEIDFNERQLCPDDSCIGVIGPNGRCNECGRASPVPVNVPVPVPVPDSETDTETDSETDSETETDSDSGDRVLCPDESCVGLIGADGRCKVCGTPASASS